MGIQGSSFAAGCLPLFSDLQYAFGYLLGLFGITRHKLLELIFHKTFDVSWKLL